MSEEVDFPMYNNDEETYEMYLAAIEMYLAEPLDADVSRRIFAAYAVSPYDMHSQHLPNVRLPSGGGSIRMRLAG
jgi:hypothetical protein